jgi:hypothetical protein
MASHPPFLSLNTCRHVFLPKQKQLVISSISHLAPGTPSLHNFQDERLRLYLPGNGGLLSAIALMCAGYDGGPGPNPGFRRDGKWKVRWEGLNKLP